MVEIVVCLFVLLFIVEAGAASTLYDEGSKAYYRFHSQPATWLTAYTTCVKEGGRLAVATNENKNFFKSNFFKGATRVFLGFNDWETGSWRTIQDQSLSVAGYENWNKDEPNNAGGNQRCGAVYKDGTFDDLDCDVKSPFICQIDSFLEANTNDDGTKTYYKFHVQPATWLTAYTTCIKESGHLAIINNQKEADFFVNNFPKNSGSVFLGFNNWERNNSWFTIDGQALSEVGYEKWAPGEPNNGHGTQLCGAMYDNGKFDDNHCDSKLFFICEMKSITHATGGEIKRNDALTLYDEGSKEYYRFHDEPTTWLTAYTTCFKEGGRLAVATKENKEFFKSHFPSGATRVFLGFNYWETGSWRTIEDQYLSEAGYENWHNEEPNNAGGSQRCGAMYKDGTFDDLNCDAKSPFICQINTFSEGYTSDDGTKNYYKFHDKGATWLTAHTTCIEESGHLAIINNQEEADFFVRNFPKNSDSVFLGFNNWERNNSWFTIDGQPLSEVGYEKWAPGEPNTGGGIQRCGAMYRSGQFDDNFCNVKLPYICEKNINSRATGGEIKRNDDADYTRTTAEFITEEPAIEESTTEESTDTYEQTPTGTTLVSEAASLSLATTNSIRCEPGQWRCDDGQCVKAAVCDGELQCVDGSDEALARCKGTQRPLLALILHCSQPGASIDVVCPDACRHWPQYCYYAIAAEHGVPGTCELPPYPRIGEYSIEVIEPAGAGWPSRLADFTLLYSCPPGYRLLGLQRPHCFSGTWNADFPSCIQESKCQLKNNRSIEYDCVGAPGGKCPEWVASGQRVSAVCRRGYIQGAPTQMLCIDGRWDHETTCQPEWGTTSSWGELPWHTGIYSKLHEPYLQICGGTLVSTAVVISAAHCFWNEAKGIGSAEHYAVGVGKIYRLWDTGNDGQKSDVSDIKVPPGFRGASTNFQDDIAVLVLTTRLVMTSDVHPVRVDYRGKLDDRQLRPGNVGKVAGWQGGHVLKVMEMSSLNVTQCSGSEFLSYITSDKICGGLYKGSALCPGDGGGGLVFPAVKAGVERWYFRGVVSTAARIRHECVDNHIALTQIAKHATFIGSHPYN